MGGAIPGAWGHGEDHTYDGFLVVVGLRLRRIRRGGSAIRPCSLVFLGVMDAMSLPCKRLTTIRERSQERPGPEVGVRLAPSTNRAWVCYVTGFDRVFPQGELGP